MSSSAVLDEDSDLVVPGFAPGGTRGEPAPPVRPWAGPAPALGVALVALGAVATTTALAPPGAHWPVIALAVVGCVHLAGRRVPWGSRRRRGAASVLAVALVGVAAVRAEVMMTLLCLLAAMVVAACTVTDARTARELGGAPFTVLGHAFLALPWLARPLRVVRSGRWAPWWRGVGLGVALMGVVGGLLTSADAAFAALVTVLMPRFDLPLVQLGLGLGVVGAAAALAFTRALPEPEPGPLRVPPPRHPAEWLLPLVLLDVVLLVWVLVRLGVSFGAYPEGLLAGGPTPAERARQGFGELVWVTVLVAAAVGWAAWRSSGSGGSGRRRLALAGGVALLALLVVVASALRRLWLYEQTFGWTALRIQVGAFELWVAAAVLLAGWLWWRGRARAVPYAVLVSAAVALLALGLAAPDALAARWNVDRFERTGHLDVAYLSTLSDDAVPDLMRLPEPERSCALVESFQRHENAWYAANLGRWRADRVLFGRVPSGHVAPGPCQG